MRSVRSGAKTTGRDRTGAGDGGSVVEGSGRTGPSRPAPATSGHIPVHMLSPQRSGRSPLGPPQLRACLDGLGRSPVSTTTASCDFRFGGHSVTSGRWPGGSASSMTSAGGTRLGKSLTCGFFLVIPQPAHEYRTPERPLAPVQRRALPRPGRLYGPPAPAWRNG